MTRAHQSLTSHGGNLDRPLRGTHGVGVPPFLVAPQAGMVHGAGGAIPESTQATPLSAIA